ncbi:MAG: helix-turn-helix domain-containing protein [Acidobacteriia bacterium]|nr:helix-turn-helix domain-containing protein [Terriglobia bacterium]
MNNIGARLKALRLAKGLSQSDVIRRSGLAGPYLSRVENGHTVPTLRSLETLAKAFQIEFYQLFYNGQNPQAVVTFERECAEQVRQAMAERDQILKKVQVATLRLSEHLGYMSKLVASGLGIKQIARSSSHGRPATPKSRTLSKARRG